MSNSYYENKRFMIISTIRSGGTLLSHALDSHPDIYCHRDEIVHKNDPIYRTAGTPFTAIDTIYKLKGYCTNGVKLTYEQLNQIGIEAIRTLKVDKVIHLYRKNPLRQIVSEAVRLEDKKRGLNTHIREFRNIQRVTLDPHNLVDKISQYYSDVWNMQKTLQQIAPANDRLELTYEQISYYGSNIERDLGFHIQQFLGLAKWQILTYQTVRRNPYELFDIIENYTDVANYLEVNAPRYYALLKMPENSGEMPIIKNAE